MINTTKLAIARIREMVTRFVYDVLCDEHYSNRCSNMVRYERECTTKLLGRKVMSKYCDIPKRGGTNSKLWIRWATQSSVLENAGSQYRTTSLPFRRYCLRELGQQLLLEEGGYIDS